MPIELSGAAFGASFTKVEVEGQVRSRVALARIARIIEKQAKINASTGSHKRGTKTPAQPGTGPAVISGTLRRSVTHSPVVKRPGGWETRVGTAAGMTPPYGRTASSKYGKALETGLKNGTKFPWLYPAFRFGVRVAPGVNHEVFGHGWSRL